MKLSMTSLEVYSDTFKFRSNPLDNAGFDKFENPIYAVY